MADYVQGSRVLLQSRDDLLPTLNAADGDGNTLLHACALSIDHEAAQEVMDPRLVTVVRRLLDMGIEFAKNAEGLTPADLFLSNGAPIREVHELFPSTKKDKDTEDCYQHKSSIFEKPTNKKVAGIW